MGGGLMQLVAYGAQDIYLTGNPQITFFKVVYRRHTNFSMEAIQQTFNGTVAATSSSVSATISRNGDLVSKCWLDVKLIATATAGDYTADGSSWTNWCNNTGHAFVKSCEVEIGGQLIDRHYSQWLDIRSELMDHDNKEYNGLNKNVAKDAYLHEQNTSLDGARYSGNKPTPNTRLYIPLKFWFCNNPGLALPLIALQYHEVKIKLVTRSVYALVNTSATLGTANMGSPVCTLWVDYIYLDTDERRRFAQVSHEYLIEQVQRNTGNSTATAITSQKLNFNHPVKELIWVIQDSIAATERTTAVKTAWPVRNIASLAQFTEGNDYFNYGPNSSGTAEVIKNLTNRETFDTLKLQLNGHDRFAARNASYFRLCQPDQAGHKIPNKHIYLYSFALKPEEHQPSGSCNFSRIDNANMRFGSTGTLTNATLTVYAINYNVLRIMSGMGGLAYSN